MSSLTCKSYQSRLCLFFLYMFSLPAFAQSFGSTPSLRQMTRDSGYIFAGKVTGIERVADSLTADVSTVRITFQVEQGIRGVRTGQTLVIREWVGLWEQGERYRLGERVLLLLYRPSQLGLTSPVAGPWVVLQLIGTGKSTCDPSRLCPCHSAIGRGVAMAAGVTYFDAGTKGTPLTWAQGSISYYTDQGDLSPLLVHAAADLFVADAFSDWTSIPTAAVATTLAGQLGEDVNGTNVIANSNGTFTMPSDILPTAVNKPVAIVYDSDGAVTSALLGSGAGNTLYCFTNSVFGGADSLSTNARLLHALVIVNGNCAQTSSQLPDLKYRMVRTFGRVLGLDWSQVNLNVITRNPVPTAADYAGFTIMHATDSISCVPISICYTNPDQPKMDDRASLSRLYPVTPQNQSNFPGKQLFFENTIRIQGRVHLVDATGQPAQPMQGVNVMARWVDPTTGLASRAYAAASVSG